MNKQQLTYRITSAYRVTVLVTLGAAISANVALADDRPDAPSAVSSPPVPAVAPLRTTSNPPAPEFAPMTGSERFRNYLVRIGGPQPFITAAAVAGISQAEDTPKEWRGGAEGYGKRIGDATLNTLFAELWSTGYRPGCTRTIATLNLVKLVSSGAPSTR